MRTNTPQSGLVDCENVFSDTLWRNNSFCRGIKFSIYSINEPKIDMNGCLFFAKRLFFPSDASSVRNASRKTFCFFTLPFKFLLFFVQLCSLSLFLPVLLPLSLFFLFSSVSPFHTLLPLSLFISAVFTSFFPFSLFYSFLFSSSCFLTIPLSSLFLSPPSIFISYLCHSFKLVFHVSRLSKCFT